MKRAWMLGWMVALVIGISGAANAALTVIGTAHYQGNDYKMIYLDDGPSGPITWLDYTRNDDTWQNQLDWASRLGAELTVTLDPDYTSTIDWSTGWRLPEVDESQANIQGPWPNDPNIGRGDGHGWGGPDESGYHDYRYGYNMVNSEMGYLYYEALGNKGFLDTDGSYLPNYGLQITGDFDSLQAWYYWSGTEYSPNPGCAWFFDPRNGNQNGTGKPSLHHALAVRPGDVSAVPIPGTVFLLASGLAGIGALGNRVRRRRR